MHNRDRIIITSGTFDPLSIEELRFLRRRIIWIDSQKKYAYQWITNTKRIENEKRNGKNQKTRVKIGTSNQSIIRYEL